MSSSLEALARLRINTPGHPSTLTINHLANPTRIYQNPLTQLERVAVDKSGLTVGAGFIKESDNSGEVGVVKEMARRQLFNKFVDSLVDTDTEVKDEFLDVKGGDFLKVSVDSKDDDDRFYGSIDYMYHGFLKPGHYERGVSSGHYAFLDDFPDLGRVKIDLTQEDQLKMTVFNNFLAGVYVPNEQGNKLLLSALAMIVKDDDLRSFGVLPRDRVGNLDALAFSEKLFEDFQFQNTGIINSRYQGDGKSIPVSRMGIKPENNEVVKRIQGGSQKINFGTTRDLQTRLAGVEVYAHISRGTNLVYLYDFSKLGLRIAFPKLNARGLYAPEAMLLEKMVVAAATRIVTGQFVPELYDIILAQTESVKPQ